MRRTCGKLRKAKQKLRRRYTIDREDRMLSGDEPTLPAGAVGNEVAPVGPDPPLPSLVRQALLANWATPDSAKARAVASLLVAVLDPDTKPRERIRLVRVLLLADQTQFDSDRAEEAGRRRVVVP